MNDSREVVVLGKDGDPAMRFRLTSVDLAKLIGVAKSQVVDHTNVRVVTGVGSGLVGGGDLTEDRHLTFDARNLHAAKFSPSSPVPIGDGSASLQEINTVLDHNALRNYRATDHVDHKSVYIEGGDGLSGGGSIETTQTLRLALGKLETIGVDLDDFVPVVDRQGIHGKVSLRELVAAIVLAVEREKV